MNDLTGLDASALVAKAEDGGQDKLAAPSRSRLMLESMQIIPEESRAENETTIDYGDAESSQNQAQAVGTSILPALGLNADSMSGKRMNESNDSLPKSADVSNLVHFFEQGPN